MRYFLRSDLFRFGGLEFFVFILFLFINTLKIDRQEIYKELIETTLSHSITKDTNKVNK